MVIGAFPDEHVKTTGAEVHSIDVNGVNFDIWDIAGCKNKMGLLLAYIKNADLILLMFDYENKQTSLDRLGYFYRFIDEVRSKFENNPVLVFVGNKSDLTSIPDRRRNVLNISVKTDSVEELKEKIFSGFI